jgi:Arc/MetJ-type ribon-helix-helix transcriptional regulator
MAKLSCWAVRGAGLGVGRLSSRSRALQKRPCENPADHKFVVPRKAGTRRQPTEIPRFPLSRERRKARKRRIREIGLPPLTRRMGVPSGFTLGLRFEAFVKGLVQRGRYNNASEVVRTHAGKARQRVGNANRRPPVDPTESRRGRRRRRRFGGWSHPAGWRR